MEREEEDLEGVIPQGPSGNSIGFWFPSQRNLFFAKSEKLFCKIRMFIMNTILIWGFPIIITFGKCWAMGKSG